MYELLKIILNFVIFGMNEILTDYNYQLSIFCRYKLLKYKHRDTN